MLYKSTPLVLKHSISQSSGWLKHFESLSRNPRWSKSHFTQVHASFLKVTSCHLINQYKNIKAWKTFLNFGNSERLSLIITPYGFRWGSFCSCTSIQLFFLHNPLFFTLSLMRVLRPITNKIPHANTDRRACFFYWQVGPESSLKWDFDDGLLAGW